MTSAIRLLTPDTTFREALDRGATATEALLEVANTFPRILPGDVDALIDRQEKALRDKAAYSLARAEELKAERERRAIGASRTGGTSYTPRDVT